MIADTTKATPRPWATGTNGRTIIKEVPPLNPYRLDADGHRWVEQQSYAWRNAANAWVAACEKRDRLRSESGR